MYNIPIKMNTRRVKELKRRVDEFFGTDIPFFDGWAFWERQIMDAHMFDLGNVGHGIKKPRVKLLLALVRAGHIRSYSECVFEIRYVYDRSDCCGKIHERAFHGDNVKIETLMTIDPHDGEIIYKIPDFKKVWNESRLRINRLSLQEEDGECECGEIALVKAKVQVECRGKIIARKVVDFTI